MIRKITSWEEKTMNHTEGGWPQEVKTQEHKYKLEIKYLH